MKISIKKEKFRFSIRIPNILIFSRFGASFVKVEIKKNGGKSHRISAYPECMKDIRRCIKEMRKVHKDWNFVEALDSDGTSVRIKL